jgi:hypothetical protein
MHMVEIDGNTYPVRDKLKALGGRPVRRGTAWVWLVPADKAEEAKTLVASAVPSRQRPSRNHPTGRTCQRCHCRINYGAFCGKCEYGR